MYEVTTEKTNYGSYYTTLNDYITPLLISLTTTSDIVGATFRLNFSNYYTSKVGLLNKISDVIKAKADGALQPDTSYNSTYITQNGIQVKNATDTEVVNMGEFATGLYGLRASHSDSAGGGYTQLTANGLERLVNGVSKPYQYLTFIEPATTHGLSNEGDIRDLPVEQWSIISNAWKYGKWVDLPIDFQNKDFKATISIADFPILFANNTSVETGLNIAEIDYVNARIRVVAYFWQSGFVMYPDYSYDSWMIYTGFNLAIMVIA